MEDLRKQRSGNGFPGIIGRNPFYAQGTHPSQLPKAQHGPMYLQHTRSMMSHGQGNDNLSTLTHNFGGMNLQSPSYAQSTSRSLSMSTHASDYAGVHPISTGLPLLYNNQVLYPANLTHGTSPGYTALPASSAIHGSAGPQYLSQVAYPGYSQHVVENSPNLQAWSGYQSRVSSGEVPSLATPRRDSSSSNEHDAPGTPFTHYTGFGGPGVAIVDYSPNTVSWTPSPPQNEYAGGKNAPVSPVSLHIQMLVQQDPPIPRAVPAPFSPMKPLDRSLENPNGVTNVYVRGLVPTTTDEVLHKLASRFGEIVSSKSIIDHNTGLCKGYGFIKYHNFKDAENCIRGFHSLGYETSFARESFYAQLKKLSDDDNTNLYVSNLPKDMNEHELGAIFAPHKVCSSRILRDGAGNGRGVGFARFESRAVCDEVIKSFNNTPIAKTAGEEHLVQIRFADTQDQKQLKQQTTAARQYRTAEYESQTRATSQFFDSARFSTIPNNGIVTGEDFESYMMNTTGGQTVHYNQGQDARVSNLLTGVTSSGNPSSAHLHVNGHTMSGVKSDAEARPAQMDMTEKTANSPLHATFKTDGTLAAEGGSVMRD